MTQSTELSRLIARELDTLRDELLAYPDEADMWARPEGVPNSAGNLALHLAGNLRWFIGAQYGATGYVRDRDAEFGARSGSRTELLAIVQATRDEVTRTLASMDPTLLNDTFPQELAGMRFPAGRFLTHLACHLAYHLGQIDFHRRMVTKSGASVGALPLPPLVG